MASGSNFRKNLSLLPPPISHSKNIDTSIHT